MVIEMHIGAVVDDGDGDDSLPAAVGTLRSCCRAASACSLSSSGFKHLT